MESNDISNIEIKEGTKVSLHFSSGNKIIEAKGQVKIVSSNSVTIQIDITDKNLTLPTGTDIYVLEKVILYNVTDSSNFPEIKAVEISRRNHARVDDTLKINYKNIPLEDYNKNVNNPHVIFEEIFGKAHRTPEIRDINLETLYELICQINLKVDHFLDALECASTRKYSPAKYEQVNISASGMRFTANCNFQIGNVLAFRIFLPLTTEAPINVMGKVVAITDSEIKGEYTVSVKFIDLTENDQEMITKYIFKRQRELLRRHTKNQIQNPKNRH